MTTQGDSDVRLQPGPNHDLWALPDMRKVSIERRLYQPARKHMRAGTLIERAEGIEIIIETDGEIPMRSLSPALYVGDIALTENERVAPNMHRFFVFDERALRAGAPIVLGWVGHQPPSKRSKFHYQAPSSEESP